MKNQIFCTLIFCTFLFACKKTPDYNATISLQASKTAGIKLGEPVVFTASQVSIADSMRWNVSPSNNVIINSNGNTAAIVFGNPGTFTVSAANSSGNSIDTVHVDSTYFIPTPNSIQPIAGDDDIIITPSLVGLGDSVAIQFQAITSKKYNCLNNFLLSQQAYFNGQLNLSYTGVGQIGVQCNTGNVQGISNIRLHPFLEGSNVFKIVVNGTEYNGTVTKSGRNHIFSWQYISKVIFSKLVVN